MSDIEGRVVIITDSDAVKAAARKMKSSQDRIVEIKKQDEGALLTCEYYENPNPRGFIKNHKKGKKRRF